MTDTVIKCHCEIGHLDMAICHDICPFRRTRNNGFLQKQTTSRARTHQKICRSLLLHKSCYEPQTFIMSYPRIFCIWTIFFKHWLANQYFRFVNSHAFQCNKRLSLDLLGNYPFPYIAFVGYNKRLDEANFDVKTMKIEKWGWSKKQNKR